MSSPRRAKIQHGHFAAHAVALSRADADRPGARAGMAKRDPKVDAYIAEAAPFARPILRRLRKIVHAGCPAVEETIKWGFPHFVYKGNVAGMAAFRQHCVFGFWKDALLFNRESGEQKEAMGQFGRLTHVSELPDETVLIGYVKKAAALNEDGIKVARGWVGRGRQSRCRMISRRRCRKIRALRETTRASVRVSSAIISSGSRKPSATRPAGNASRLRSHGSRKERATTGNTRASRSDDFLSRFR